MDPADIADHYYDRNEDDIDTQPVIISEPPYCQTCSDHKRGVMTEKYGAICMTCFLKLDNSPFDPRQAA